MKTRVTRWDGARPVPGDGLRTPRGSCYLVLAVLEPTRPGVAYVFRMVIERIPNLDGVQGRVFGFQWDSRGRKPRPPSGN